MEEFSSLIGQVESKYASLKKDLTTSSEKNIHFFKILATVKNDLERTLKKPELLFDAIYNCIDLLRANTPYYSTNEGANKIDPPLSDSDKVLHSFYTSLKEQNEHVT